MLHLGDVATPANFRLSSVFFAHFLFQPRLALVSLEPGADFFFRALGVFSPCPVFHLSLSSKLYFLRPNTGGPLLFFRRTAGGRERGERETQNSAQKKPRNSGFLAQLNSRRSVISSVKLGSFHPFLCGPHDSLLSQEWSAGQYTPIPGAGQGTPRHCDALSVCNGALSPGRVRTLLASGPSPEFV